MAALPPSSRPTFLIPADLVIISATGTEPVKLMTRGISELTSAPPTSESPYITDKASLIANSDSINNLANLYAVKGASGVGFSTTVLPATKAGASLCATRLRGKLKGVIHTTTPTETREKYASVFLPLGIASVLIVSPCIVRIVSADKVRVSIHLSTSIRAKVIGFATSSVIVCAISSLFSASFFATSKSHAHLCASVEALATFVASCAIFKALFASSILQIGA